MREMLARSTSVAENLAAFRQFWLNLIEDQEWVLLLLEFKLFSTRHPKSKKRFQSLLDGALAQSPEKTLIEILGPAGKGKEAVSRSAAVRTIQPILSALALESKFAPGVLGRDVMRKIVSQIFDALLETQGGTTGSGRSKAAAKPGAATNGTA
jgi:hypothetical protein